MLECPTSDQQKFSLLFSHSSTVCHHFLLRSRLSTIHCLCTWSYVSTYLAYCWKDAMRYRASSNVANLASKIDYSITQPWITKLPAAAAVIIVSICPYLTGSKLRPHVTLVISVRSLGLALCNTLRQLFSIFTLHEAQVLECFSAAPRRTFTDTAVLWVRVLLALALLWSLSGLVANPLVIPTVIIRCTC